MDVLSLGVDVEVAVLGAEVAVAVCDLEGGEGEGQEDFVGYCGAVAAAFVGC